jgi:hypothetical protein
VVAERVISACSGITDTIRDRQEPVRNPDRAEGTAALHTEASGLVLFTARIDKRAHPEVEEAERPLDDALLECVRAVSGEDPMSSDDLATAAEAAAHGHAMMLLDGDFGDGDAATEEAAQRAAAATLALIEGRRLLRQRSDPKT